MRTSVTRRKFLSHCGHCVLFLAGAEALDLLALASRSSAQGVERGRLGRKLSPYFTKLEDRRIRCELCPRQCEAEPGERGYCRVRENVDGSYYTLVYGNPCSIHIDPIEKKPFFHVLPSTLSFSLATAGCNFNCKFCQNWEISQAKPEDTYNYDLPPEEVVRHAVGSKCLSIASTYVEPTIFTEYMIDISALAKKHNLLNVMHSNGYVNAAPLNDLCKYLDAACIDLKGFTPDYYQDMTEGTLDPVLETLKRLKRNHVHVEIVNLVVPEKNDDMGKVREMCRWIRQELDPDVPLHFTRFYPLYRLKSLPPTPVETLDKAWKTAREEGLSFVYIGNVPGHEGEHTVCPKCKARLIRRLGYQVEIEQLKNGACGKCGQPIPGIWKLPEA